MRGTRAKMIRKSVARFPKQKLEVVINRRLWPFPETFRYSVNSFQRNYRDVKRIAA